MARSSIGSGWQNSNTPDITGWTRVAKPSNEASSSAWGVRGHCVWFVDDIVYQLSMYIKGSDVFSSEGIASEGNSSEFRPTDSFIPKVISDTMIRMPQALSVSENIVQNYAKSDTRRKGLNKITFLSTVQAFLHSLFRLSIVDVFPALSEPCWVT